MNDKEDVMYLMEFRQTHQELWEEFLDGHGVLAEWKEYAENY